VVSKTITIKKEVYDLLIGLKRRDESFSDLLERLAKMVSPRDLLEEMSASMDLGNSEDLLNEIRMKREDWR
jgi:predicted CopG family antitoxin